MTPEDAADRLMIEMKYAGERFPDDGAVRRRITEALRTYGDRRAEEMRGQCAAWLVEEASQLTTDTPLLDLLAEKVKSLPATPPPVR